MLTSAKASVLSCILEHDYIYPSIEMVHDLLSAYQFPEELLKSRFTTLIDLVTHANISEVSKNLAYGAEDDDLRKSIKSILGSDNTALLNDLYVSLYTLLHQYVLNKCPDKQSDIEQNALVAQRIELENLSREALFEQTVPLLGTLLHRLEKFEPGITSDKLKQQVIAAINSAKEKTLAAPKKEEKAIDPLLPPSNFVPAYKDQARLLKQRQIVEDEELAERLAREFQEEEDRAVALALQVENVDDDNDEEAEPEGEAEVEAEPDDEPEDEVDNDDQDEVDNKEQDEEDASSSHSQSKVRRLNHP